MKKIIGYIVLICLVIGCIVGFYSITGFYVMSDVAVNSKLVRKENTFSIHNVGSVYADGEIINATGNTITINPNEIIIYCKDINTDEVFTYSNALPYTIKKKEKITIAVNILQPPHYITTESGQQARYIAENFQIFKLEYKPTDGEAYEIMSLRQTNSYFLPLGTIIAVPIIVCEIVVLLIIFNKSDKKSREYLKANFSRINSISEKYSELAQSCLETIRRSNEEYFFDPYTPSQNALITAFWRKSPLFEKIFQYDGFKQGSEKFDSARYSSNLKVGQHAIELLFFDLKQKLTTNKEWTDIKSIPYVAYFIIRNYIVRSNYWRLQKLIPKGLENYRMELDIIATSATDSAEQSTLGGDKEIIVEDFETEDDKQARHNEEAKRQSKKEAEQMRQDKRRQSIAYLNANKEKLILKYSTAVQNYIEKIIEIHNGAFLRLFNDTGKPMTSMLVNPYRNQHHLFCDTIKRDGLDFTESSDTELSKNTQKLTDTFISGLKRRIKENNEWEDEYTLPILLYYIVRNNIIKYYHDFYLKKISCLTLEEFCEQCHNCGIQQPSALAYTYYYIYENDINLPFMETYKKLCAEMLQTVEKQKQRKLENDLFGTPKPKSTYTNNSFYKTLSPIERVDRMNGKEFEIYMEQFFTKMGYKVERTPLSGDYGVDLIIEHTFGRTGVQLKCYSKKVPADAVQQIVTGLRHYKLSNGMVITNNYFQKEAITLAAENHIELWDRDILIKKL